MFAEQGYAKVAGKNPLNILILYDPHCTGGQHHYHYLQSFSQFSRHNIFYVPGQINDEVTFNLDLSKFDVVVLHYSIRLCFDWLEPTFIKPLENYQGLKVAFIQDEYDRTEIERQWLERLKIRLIFTCVPSAYREQVYPTARFPDTKFITVLTGYVPANFAHLTDYIKPLSERHYVIGYRGRQLPYRYGNLGREKWLLAKQLRDLCEQRQLVTNIAWEDTQRLYGDNWFHFLADCRVVIGMESGSNVFDDYGTLERNIEQALQANPQVTYEEIFARYLAPYEGQIKMNQASPRIFEAIAVKTGLVLFEGHYSGIVQPDLHYISL